MRLTGPPLQAVLVSVMTPRGGRQAPHHTPSPGLTSLLALSSCDLVVGDTRGAVRGLRCVREAGDKQPPLREHGSLKITRPRDPTKPLMQELWRVELGAPVTSLSLQGFTLLVGTSACEMQQLFLGARELLEDASLGGAAPGCGASQHPATCKLRADVPPSRLLATSCTSAVHDLAFPRGLDHLLVTAGVGGVRVWCLATHQELLRHAHHGLVALACDVTHDRSTILAGWEDGGLSGVGAESGRQLWRVTGAHQGPLSALCALSSPLLVTGGHDGKTGGGRRAAGVLRERRSLRRLEAAVWDWGEGRQVGEGRGHTQPLTRVKVSPSGALCASASADGALMVWRLPEP
ncbi:cilia- and flagella-associated protein 52-like [Hyalella azteca]|uniref:Cilia- and flagella-associated protein 52 n=1 Tax=Hyalella azteca TaxID=294128 RepID=A0A979FJD3_HYAAZ|nr:cilia- and flagella-associated protein 52-like [Hyalella azteca]